MATSGFMKHPISVSIKPAAAQDDIIASEEVGEYVHRQIPGSKLVLLNATGHCPNLSAPREVIAAIRDFV
jgi:sigma-B regulation protein RsbQ